ncbi:MAG: 1-acyl-sn-glycerol-3-phosphate acyltransferase [Bacteroidales bacterium]|nr:1-acyl-sn-glycerol-3-phosphate acyltransferase [Bacteroidales bacterium]
MYAIYKYLFVVPVFAINTVLATVFVFILSIFSPKSTRYCGVVWAKIMQWITPMPVKVVGRENIAEGQSYVIACNHQSAYDIFVIYGSLDVDFRWILKQELRKVPVLGFACERLGHIFIERSSRRAAYDSIQRAKKVLVGGTSVVIFPEGTRSGKAEMGTFKHGAFKMAMDLQLPIVPVSIKDTYKVMGKSLATLKPGHATLTIHKPIDITEYEERRDDLIEAVRSSIASAV